MPWLYVPFFCSGFPALIYQIIWQRALFSIYGINIESVTIVVSAFMPGLGIGSFLGGMISKRGGVPLLATFGGIELSIAIFGFFSLPLFHAVGLHTSAAPQTVTALLTFALVLLPTVLMDSTLPILVAHLVRISGNVGTSGLATIALFAVAANTFKFPRSSDGHGIRGHHTQSLPGQAPDYRRQHGH